MLVEHQWHAFLFDEPLDRYVDLMAMDGHQEYVSLHQGKLF